jgi:hypothetical protein
VFTRCSLGIRPRAAPGRRRLEEAQRPRAVGAISGARAFPQSQDAARSPWRGHECARAGAGSMTQLGQLWACALDAFPDLTSCRRLRCEECWCVSDSARAWFAFVADLPDDEDPPAVATYCPPCAAKHFDKNPRERDYT